LQNTLPAIVEISYLQVVQVLRLTSHCYTATSASHDIGHLLLPKVSQEEKLQLVSKKSFSSNKNYCLYLILNNPANESGKSKISIKVKVNRILVSNLTKLIRDSNWIMQNYNYLPLEKERQAEQLTNPNLFQTNLVLNCE